MGHSTCLHFIGKVTYYIGWIALLCGALTHIHIATDFFLSVRMTQRNLLEIGVVCFVICIASELRAHGATCCKETPSSAKKTE